MLSGLQHLRRVGFLKAMVLLTVLLGLPLWTRLASGVDTNEDLIAREAENAFKKIVGLWKEESYEELYEQGRIETQRMIPKQDFVQLMQDSHVRLQCCWATVQNVKGITTSSVEVYVKATIGYEHFLPMGTGSPILPSYRWKATSTFKEETFLLHQEKGLWKIDLQDILAASGYTLKHREILKDP